MRNYAYIDTQNLHLGIQNLGWKLNLRAFRNYLRQSFDVIEAYMFLGYMAEHQELYEAFKNAGYTLMFKPLTAAEATSGRGNIDADLVLQAMIDYPLYDQAVIITNDGDFQGLVNHLYATNKLRTVMSPNEAAASTLLKAAAHDRIVYLDRLRRQLEYRQKRQPRAPKPNTQPIDKPPSAQ